MLGSSPPPATPLLVPSMVRVGITLWPLSILSKLIFTVLIDLREWVHLCHSTHLGIREELAGTGSLSLSTMWVPRDGT